MIGRGSDHGVEESRIIFQLVELSVDDFG